MNKRTDRLSDLDVVERVDELLEVAYRSADLGNVADVLDETVYILLSKQTREAVYQQVYRDLRWRYPRWGDVLAAPLDDLEAVLKPAGLHKQRARELQLLLAQVRDDNAVRGIRRRKSDLTLEYLRDLNPKDAEAFLKALPGVGTKTARCVAMYALEHDEFPVDTHVARIFDRLGLVRMAGWKPVHEDYQDLVPKRLRRRLHINLVHHGRAVCRSRTPACGSCVLISFCEKGRSKEVTGRKPVAVDLFAGAGGMGKGFADAGFRVAVAVELDRPAAQTYRANHPGVPVVEMDVTTASGPALRSFAPSIPPEPTVTMAGPPCQGYSAAGRRDPHEERNYLYEEVVRIAGELKSKAVVIENVPGVAGVGGVEFTDSIVGELREAGYTSAWAGLEGPDFGVPQRRQRLIFIGIRSDLNITPQGPEPTHRRPAACSPAGLPETPTLAELLKQLPDRSHGVTDDAVVLSDGTTVYNAATMAHSDQVVRKISEILPGKGPLSYRRLDTVLATTIIAGHRALPVHPWIDRTISVREAAIIQGFPLDYTFLGFRSQQPLQVANAVPPPLAKAVGEHLMSLFKVAGVPLSGPSGNRVVGIRARGKEALQSGRPAAMVKNQITAIP